MEFELPKINVSFEYDEEKDEIVFVINGVEKRVKTEDMITEMGELQEQNTALEQQPCEDCISRKSILNRFENMNEVYTFASIGDLRKVIESMPSVYPKPIECEDCISRDAVQNYVESHIQEINTGYGDLNNHTNRILRMIVDGIGNLPSIQPKPNTGHWIEDDMTYCGVELVNYKCDKCGEMGGAWRKGLKPDKLPKYCMNCGAKMLPTDSEKE